MGNKLNQNRIVFFVAGTFLGGFVLNAIASLLRGGK